ncbi:MAG: glycyl-radical enzyme activating protein [Victivallales bacterium]
MTRTTGIVFDIQKFSIHDGPGIRTTVFLKGCPLNCLWCHNPESKQGKSEISFISDKCILCGYCAAMCPNKCHVIGENGHVYNRANCQRCGKCTSECYSKALEVIGREMTVEEVISEVLKDVPFYETSNGGMTISGGEPMAQFQFTKSLLEEAKKHKLHNCVETSGFAPMEKYRKIAGLVDIFLYDMKESNPEKHMKCTGVPLDTIVKNLVELDSLGAKTVLRCPIIPKINDRKSHFREIANLANRLSNIIEINILAYHPLGKSKSARIGTDYLLESNEFPEENEIRGWIDSVQGSTKVPVKKG